MDGDHGERLATVEEKARSLTDRVASLEGKVGKLQQFHTWITGAASAIAFVGGVMADEIKARLGVK